eukprot:UN09176
MTQAKATRTHTKGFEHQVPTALEIYNETTRQKMPKQFITVTTDMKLTECADIMMEGMGFGLLLVVENGELLGRVSERRIMNAVHKLKGKVENATVGEFMIPITGWVTPRTPLYDCMEIMHEKTIRHLTIMGDSKDPPVDLDNMDKLFKKERKT